MEQASFNQIQAKFKQFLTGQLHPSPDKHVITNSGPTTSPKPIRKIREIERTTAFGSQDEEIGYKATWTGKDGTSKTKIYL